MVALARALELTARWRRRARPRGKDDVTLDAVLSWIRTIGFEDDVLALETRGGSPAYFRFEMPSEPSAQPAPVADSDARARVRFVVRKGSPPRTPCEAGWRPILRVHDLIVLERDAPHGRDKPLRLGLDDTEGLDLLARARRSAEGALAGEAPDGSNVAFSSGPSRLTQRGAVAVAVWTRGRLRGSVIMPPGPALRTVAQAAIAACRDSRFPRLSAADLGESVFQIGLLHSPRVPLSRHAIETCDAYPDKALFVSEGPRSGVYMPEAFNVLSQRIVRLRALADAVAREKAGMNGLGAGTRVEVCEVTEFVESADRKRAVRLDGPVALVDGESAHVRAADAGRAACAWLAAIQGEDGSLPLFIRPSSGKGEGTDVVRSAMTAEALAAFGSAYGLESALETARRVLDWLDRTGPHWLARSGVALPAAIYRGKAAAHLGDEPKADAAARSVLERLDEGGHPPIVLAHALSLLDQVSGRHATAARKCQSLRLDLGERFRRATTAQQPVSLAEWAELGAASPLSSGISRDVRDWLRREQLPSGAFPASTTSEFVYSRGTGKIFEVLALHPNESPEALEGALRWLLSMQYRPDSAFFVPHEHWGRVLGGLRHDAYGPDAWIDAAGHFLLGLARLRRHAPQ